jgi:hypothetical protein
MLKICTNTVLRKIKKVAAATKKPAIIMNQTELEVGSVSEYLVWRVNAENPESYNHA